MIHLSLKRVLPYPPPFFPGRGVLIIGKDIGAGLKGLVGGEMKSYTAMMEEARDIALKRLISKASDAGANAIVGMRFMTSSIIQGASEVIAYGTAVFVE